MFAFVRRFARLGHLITVLVVAAALSCARDEAPTTPLYSLEDCDIEPEGPMFESSLPCMLDDPNPNALGLFTTWSEEMCVEVTPGTAWQDLDEDGAHDACENATAAAFAPMLVFASQDCSWDNGLGRMGGEYYWAVEIRTNTPPNGPPYQVLRIAYLPAYYWDCGNPSSSIGSTWIDPPHSGDSEFILIDVRYDDESHHWVTNAVFLSAHCHAPDIGPIHLDANCQLYSPTAFPDWGDGRGLGAPVVWVGMSKHPNYPTAEQCDGGALGSDICIFDTAMRFPIIVQTNIGSRGHPFRDCAYAFSGSTMVSPIAVECMWTYHPNTSLRPFGRFNGWQITEMGPAPSPYGQLLGQYAGF